MTRIPHTQKHKTSLESIYHIYIQEKNTNGSIQPPINMIKEFRAKKKVDGILGGLGTGEELAPNTHKINSGFTRITEN